MPRAFLIKNKVKCSNSISGGGAVTPSGESVGSQPGEEQNTGRGGGDSGIKEISVPTLITLECENARNVAIMKELSHQCITQTQGQQMKEEKEEGPQNKPSNLHLPARGTSIPQRPATPVGSTGATIASPPSPPSPPPPPPQAAFPDPKAPPPGALGLPRPCVPPGPTSTDQPVSSVSWGTTGMRSFNGREPTLLGIQPTISDVKRSSGFGEIPKDALRFGFNFQQQQQSPLLMDSLCSNPMLSTTYSGVGEELNGYHSHGGRCCPLGAGTSPIKAPHSIGKWGPVIPHKPQVFRPIPAHPAMVDIFHGGRSTLFSSPHASINGIPTKSALWRNASPAEQTHSNVVLMNQKTQGNPKALFSPNIGSNTQSGGMFSISKLMSNVDPSQKCKGMNGFGQLGVNGEKNTQMKKEVKSGEEKSLCRPWSNNSGQTGGEDRSRAPVTFLGIDFSQEQPPRRTMNPPRYQCEACNKSYATFSGLSKHKQFHCVSQIKKQFSCKFCEKNYVSLGALKMHIRTHTLPCKCHLCGKAFSRPWLLQGHVRTHTGEKPFQCSHCGRSFADRSNLRAHLQTHTDIKKYNCRNCSKTFSRMSLLLKHQDGGCPGVSV